ncbi:hypothetical protein MMC30_001587 [Trapelia coarctata]|nr:hypothetical protein [Trapelia coarctata]
MATKTSILIFYLSLAKNQQVFRIATWSTLVVVNVAGLALTFLNIFQCRPVGAVFAATVPASAICTDIVALYLSSAPVNIITDLAILFLPMPILTGLRLPLKQKIILVITFGFGFFVVAVDVVRIAYLQSAFQTRLTEVGKENAATSTSLEQDDFSWYASLSFMWSAVEVEVGIICACVPALKPLASRVIPSILRDTSNPNDVSQSQYVKPAPIDLNQNMENRLSSPPRSPMRATPPLADGTEDDGEMGMMDFLTMPDSMTDNVTRQRTVATVATTATRANSQTYFDFYNMKEKKPMTKLGNKESIVPIALVTILFFLWGFAYGLLATLNSQFQLVATMSTGQGLGLHAAYYGAYFVGPLTVGQYVFKRWGFKATFITGLCIYACGTLIFWPSAVLTSFPAFLVSNFIVGFGVSILEVAANPFVALCGPPQYMETRLNISQGVQAVGTIVSPLLAQKVLFKNVLNGPSLIDVQWAYLAISLFDVVLAVAFYYMPLPEATDEDFEAVASKRHSINSAKINNIPVTYVTLALGIFSMFCYVGGQEAVAGPFESYISIVKPDSVPDDPFNYTIVGHTVFAAGRFLSALLDAFIKPRYVLLALFTGMIITSALAMVLTGRAGVAMIILIQLFESGIFPLIYAISLRGLGSSTKSGAVYLTAAISGGAILPVIMYPVANAYGLRYSFCVIVAASAFGIVFPVYLIAVPKARRQVDPVHRHKRERPVLPTENPREKGGRVGKVPEARRRKKEERRADGPVANVEDRLAEWPG